MRFIQLYHRDWDHHGGIKDGIKLKVEEVDRPLAALIKDLKRRGMLDDTLLVFTGEFGRTPMSQGGSGRDHHMKGFRMLLAGGGIKGGVSHGATDEFGYHAEREGLPGPRPARDDAPPARHRPRTPDVQVSRAATTDSPTSTGMW